MTIHVDQRAIGEAVMRVANIAKQLDREELSVQERVNVAVSYLVEGSDQVWPLATQREIMQKAENRLQAEIAPKSADSPAPGIEDRSALRGRQLASLRREVVLLVRRW